MTTLFSLWVRLAPDWEHGREHFFLCFFFIYLAFFSFLKCRRVGLGPGAGT